MENCWNTYHPLGLNRIVKFPELYEIRISVFIPSLNSYTSKFYFLEHISGEGNVLRVYEHSPSLEYAKVDFSYFGYIFRVEYSNKNGKLFCNISPISFSDPHTLILILVCKGWNQKGDVELSEKDTFLFPSFKEGKNFYGKIFQDFYSNYRPGKPSTYGIYFCEEELIEDLKKINKLNEKTGINKIAAIGFSGGVPVKLFVSDKLEKLKIEKEIVKSRRNYLKNSPKICGGPFKNSLPVLQDAISWCVVYDRLNGRVYTPINRSWIDNYMVRIGFDRNAEGPLLGLWDNLFNALLHSVFERELAEKNIIAVLDDTSLIEGIYPPNYIVSKFRSGDRSQPPIGSLICWKIYRRFKNKDFLKWVYPRLKKWHSWWKVKRDGNKDGLLEWGSNYGLKEEGNDAGTLFAAKCESGMDNSPLYDDAEYVRETMTMNLTDIGLNSMFCADAFYLSKIAAELEIENDVEFFRKEYEFLKNKINEELWDTQEKTYRDRFWDKRFSEHLSPTSFYPLFAKIPDKERAEEIIKIHLLNPEEFWGEYVIPSISKKEKSYNDQIYWRGRIWPSMNYLVYLGLKEYEFEEVAFEFAKKSYLLFMKEWEERGHCHENYNAITGYGCDVPVKEKPFSEGSDRFYCWGLLLLLCGIEELIDVEMSEGIRFGCIYIDKGCKISNFKIGSSLYNLKISRRETLVERDGNIFFKSNPGVQVRNYVVDSKSVRFRIRGGGITEINLREFKKDERIEIFIDETCEKILTADEKGEISFKIFLDKNYKNIFLVRNLY